MSDNHISHAFRENLYILQCPVCCSEMSILHGQLKCNEGHCFDFSKEGYVNLLNRSARTGRYNKELFRSRRQITQSGFFDPVSEAVANEVRRITSADRDLTILDAGCGEGTFFNRTLSIIRDRCGSVNGAGVDISKSGIKLASRMYSDVLWIVADLANLPLKSNSVDIIINLLSPANYIQFRRILRKDGLLIKIVPGENYLRELRELFPKGNDKSSYSSREVLWLFKNNFPGFESSHITETVAINKEHISDLLHMTPLLWNLDENKKRKVYDIRNVTLDLYLLFGYMKDK